MKPKEKIKVFLVDDDLMFVESLKHSLKGDRTEVRTFTNGEDCLQNINEDPEIVVLDYSLNNSLNGVQVLNKIKTSHPDTKIIMLSGHDNMNIINDTMKYGAYDYIAKSETAFYKIKEEILSICDEIDSVKESERDNKRIIIINSIILLAVIVIYVLGRLL